MSTLNIELPDELKEELKDVAAELELDTSAVLSLAFQYFSQTESLENAIEATARFKAPESSLVSFPELKEELEIDINFHPLAMEEFETLETNEQVALIGELIERLSEEEQVSEGIDLVIKDDAEASYLLSTFEFGDITYRITDEMITIYQIALDESFDEDFEVEDEDFDDLDEDDDTFEFDAEEDESLN